MDTLLDYAKWLPALVVAYYFGLPLLIYFQQKFPAHPKVMALDLAELGRPLAGFLMSRTRAVVALGFDEPLLVQIPDAAPNVDSYLIMLVNRPAGDKAMVTALIGRGEAPIQTTYVEFSTKFEDGTVFNTLNSAQLNAFPPAPQAVRTQVPAVTDAAELYRLHMYRMREMVGGKKVVYERDKGLEYLTDVVLVKMYDEQVLRGWLSYDQRNDAYRTTLKGAYLIVWGLLQPFKALRTAAMNRRADRILKDFRREDAV